MNSRNVNDCWICVPICKLLRSCFGFSDTMPIFESDLVGELDDSVSVLVVTEPAILFLGFVAEVNEYVLASCVNVPRRSRHATEDRALRVTSIRGNLKVLIE